MTIAGCCGMNDISGSFATKCLMRPLDNLTANSGSTFWRNQTTSRRAFDENVFVIDYVLANVNSFADVKSADAYILT